MNSSQTLSRKTLLAIDDSVTMRKVFQMTFAGEDMTIVTAASAQEAMTHCRQHHPHVALVDISLEGTSGYELCRAIKNEFKIPVILLSSKQNPYDAAQGQGAGADEHLDKPYDTTKMIELVTKVLQQGAVVSPVIDTKPTVPLTPATPNKTAPIVQSTQAAALQMNPSKTEATPSVSTVMPIPKQSTQTQSQTSVQASTPMANMSGELAHKLQGLGLSSTQIEAVVALSREVVEKVVWEVVPVLAETLIKEEIARLTRE